MEEFIFFHDFAMVVIVLIFCAVGGALVGTCTNPRVNKGLLEGQALERV